MSHIWRRALRLPSPLRRCLATAANEGNVPDIYDIVCVGGGPAGLSLLSAIKSNPATHSLKTALIDSQDLTTHRQVPSQYSNRCSSLTPASIAYLRSIGLLEHLDRQRMQSYHGMQVWDGVSGSRISFDPSTSTTGPGKLMLKNLFNLLPGWPPRGQTDNSDSLDTQAVATMCENTNLTTALLRRMTSLTGVELFDQTKVASIDLGEDIPGEDNPDLSQWPVVTLPDSRRLAARLLVGADGVNSPVRNFAGICTSGWDYNQHGIVATLDLEQVAGNTGFRTAYQRFLPTGPIALLPLPDNKASLVWSISTPLVGQIKALSPIYLQALLNAAFRLQTTDVSYILNHLGSIDVTDELRWRKPSTTPSSVGLPKSFPTISGVQRDSVASFPLRMRHADTYVGHRIALVGDAAHTVHPLAGQGLNLGLADAEALARCIANGVQHGMDIGTSWCLDSYNSERWAKNHAVLGVCDKLHKVFSAGSGPVVWGRSTGFEILERMSGVKGMIMGAAGTR